MIDFKRKTSWTMNQFKAKKIYRIIILDTTPRDLKERISVLHASALLQAKNQDIPGLAQGQNRLKEVSQVSGCR
jgi:hypothetical protein